MLDIGGSGYNNKNPYEKELREAWKLCSKRICVDSAPGADIQEDLNSIPLPRIEGNFDIATAFDVLEHLEHPVEVLRWIPCDRLIVILPNALSWITRKMEKKFNSSHLYSFTPYTASILLKTGGWKITQTDYQLGKWSVAAKILNMAGSLKPSRVATGLIFYCARNASEQ